MAQVTQDVRQRIDWLLSYLTREWDGLAEVEREWDEWSAHDRRDFRLEWPIRESSLHTLCEHVEDGGLTPDQRVAYDDLRRLIAAQRPILDRLLQDETTA
jgi:hypothetical protein